MKEETNMTQTEVPGTEVEVHEDLLEAGEAHQETMRARMALQEKEKELKAHLLQTYHRLEQEGEVPPMPYTFPVEIEGGRFKVTIKKEEVDKVISAKVKSEEEE